MSRDLPHLVAQVFNTPHLIHGEKFELILDAIGSRILAGEALTDIEPPKRDLVRAGATQTFESGGYLADDGIAVLPVYGTLVRRGTWLDSMSGMTSYQRIQASITEMADAPSVRGIMLDVDSYGGQAGGCFDLVEYMADVAAQTSKPIWAIANEAAASAAFAIACIADRLWVPQMGLVGSVGVLAAHLDVTKADQMAGHKWTFIYAGDRKLDGNPHVPLSETAMAEEKADVDDMMTSFTELVAKNRDMTVEAVRETQARMYRGAKAVEIGFADDVGTFAEAMNAFAEHLSGSASPSSRHLAAVDQQRKFVMSKDQRTTTAQAPAPAVEPKDPAAPEVADATEVAGEGEGEKKPEPLAAKSTAPAVDPNGTDASLAAERERCIELSKIGAKAAARGVSFDVGAAIASNMSVSTAREKVLDALADADEQLPTRNASSSHTARDHNGAATVKVGYDRAIDRQYKRLGMTPPARQ